MEVMLSISTNGLKIIHIVQQDVDINAKMQNVIKLIEGEVLYFIYINFISKKL